MTIIRARRLADGGDYGRRPELVLFPGWGFASTAGGGESESGGWLEALRAIGPVTLLDIEDPGPVATDTSLWQRMLELLPDRAVWLGWSLGGTLATELAVRYPDRCAGLVTLASNPCFAARPDWPNGMAAGVFQQFRTGFERVPEVTWRRFLGLCAQDVGNRPPGEVDGRAVLRRLRETQPLPQGAGCGDTVEPMTDAVEAGCGEAAGYRPLRRGLEWLAALDTRPALAALRCPVLHLLADGDALVPAGVAPQLAALNPRGRVEVLPGVHALHLCAAATVADQLRGFLSANGLQPQRDKTAVARSFSRAAASYDGVAHLQQRVCGRLLEWLPEIPTDDGRWLDLGCGTGAALPSLAARVGVQATVALDLAEGMLQFARERHDAALWLCGDAEQLPLADASMEGVFSSLAMQWCDHQSAWQELARVLRPQGRALVATLGPQTLDSLRRAWAAVDSRVHVNRFHDRAALERALACAGLQVLRWEERTEVLWYPDVAALARELKALGAYNLNAGRPAGLGGRRRLMRLEQALAAYRGPAGIPAEYQIWYLELGHA